ncbi:XRE family transcriptional regulator [Streptomyces sp. SRF1]|uniref:helix-turn-helix domain-containing protein n=1 Tax=Streptomyces sp. SRF1 TaxID=1549642 RepID=UPI0025AFC9F9|nr:XRE family transcriptional regulator [Streptomyces sp. SRF1]MDN3059382.1 XRE family transcriptional regulator [Streptomyces sp. SRF1]
MSPDAVFRHPLAYARRMVLDSSQEELAALIRRAGQQRRVNIATTKKTVSEWERGREPDDTAQELIAVVFKVPDDQRVGIPWPLWLPAPDLPELYEPWTAAGTVAVLDTVLRSGRMDRRQFVILSGVTLTKVLHDWLTTQPDMAHAATGEGRRIPASMVNRITGRITDLQRDDDTHGGGDLIFEVEALLSLVHHYLSKNSPDETQRARLWAQAADLGRMAGWMRFDNGQHAAAQRHFTGALRAAHTSGDVLLGANVLAFAAVQHYSVGNPADADNMVRTAQTAVRGRSTPVVDAMLAARQARALAKAGDARSCFHALNRAHDLLDQGSHDADPPWAYWVQRPEVDMLTGSCMLDLGRPADAQRHFSRADAAYGPEYVRTHVLYLSRMATAQLQQRQVDAACASTSQALTLAADVHSGRSSDHVRDAVKQLLPYRRERAVRDLLDRAKAATT